MIKKYFLIVDHFVKYSEYFHKLRNKLKILKELVMIFGNQILILK